MENVNRYIKEKGNLVFRAKKVQAYYHIMSIKFILFNSLKFIATCEDSDDVAVDQQSPKYEYCAFWCADVEFTYLRLIIS